MYCHYRVNCMQVYFIKCSYYHKDIYLLKIDKKTWGVRNKKFESSFFICAFFLAHFYWDNICPLCSRGGKQCPLLSLVSFFIVGFLFVMKTKLPQPSPHPPLPLVLLQVRAEFFFQSLTFSPRTPHLIHPPVPFPSPPPPSPPHYDGVSTTAVKSFPSYIHLQTAN